MHDVLGIGISIVECDSNAIVDELVESHGKEHCMIACLSPTFPPVREYVLGCTEPHTEACYYQCAKHGDDDLAKVILCEFFYGFHTNPNVLPSS